MSLLHSFSRLLQHNALSTERQQRGIAREEETLRRLQQQVREQEQLCQALEKGIKGLYATGYTNRTELFNQQRKQAALRRRLKDSEANIVQLQADIGECQQRRAAARQQWQQLLRQRNKYQHVCRQKKRVRELKRLLTEESDMEEKQTWKR